MSQATIWGSYSTGPASPTDYSARLNDSFNAILSMHSGSSAPAYKVAGTDWADTSVSGTITVKQWDGGAWRMKYQINTSTGLVKWADGSTSYDVSSAVRVDSSQSFNSTQKAQGRANIGAVGVPTIRKYTSGATWTKPTGLFFVEVEVWGGGGGGGTAASLGGDGGTSSFGTFCIAGGGGGGGTASYGGSGGGATAGDLQFVGGAGGNVASGGYGGNGGTAPRGGGGGTINHTGGGFPGGGGGCGGNGGAGGAGGYAYALVDASSLGATETITVGAAGSSGTGGGAGGAGYVIVKE